MKKLLAILLVAVLALALVACGTEPETTTTTEAAGSSTTPDTTTTPDSDPVDPNPGPGGEGEGGEGEGGEGEGGEGGEGEGGETETPGYDLMSNYVIDEWADMVFFTFEDTHGDLDFHPAVVFKMNNAGQVYEELFFTEKNEDGSWNTANWEYNDEFAWYFIVNDQKVECKRFSLFNYGDSGYVRADLGADFSYDNFEYVDGVCSYTVKLEIYDSENELCYYADLTAYGEYVHEKPEKVEMKEASNRPEGSERVGVSTITSITGPEQGKGEGVEKLIDNDVRSKLCTGSYGAEHPVIMTFSAAQRIGAVSIVNANDNESFTGRTVVAFDIYVSTDGGETWSETPDVSFTGLDADGVAIDKATINGNYTENYYDFGKVLENVTAIKIVVNNGELYQISELIFWQG